MFEASLPMGLWVSAHLHRLSAEGRSAYVVRKGPAQGGTLLVKISRMEAGARVLTQARDGAGRLGWLPAFSGRVVPESEADAYIQRAVSRDPDLWVVEVEDAEGRNPFEGQEIG
ncbi:MAG: DUF1491 family protein [Rhodospirillaceae bacterium]|nr:DUF1491 family protein [Rhodospirillaceae bacterium]